LKSVHGERAVQAAAARVILRCLVKLTECPPCPSVLSSPCFRTRSRPGAPVNLAGTYRGQYNMGPLSPHSDPYYVYAEGARPGMVAAFN